MKARTLGLIIIVEGTIAGVIGHAMGAWHPEYVKLGLAGNVIQVIGFLIGMLK